METFFVCKNQKDSQSAQKHGNMETHITQPTTVNHRRVLLRLYHDLIMNYLLAQLVHSRPTTGQVAHMNLHTGEKTAHISLDILTNGWVGVQASLEARCVEFYIFFGRQHTRKACMNLFEKQTTDIKCVTDWTGKLKNIFAPHKFPTSF